MPRKSSKPDWDLRSNINPGPGSQGTLFSGGDRYRSPERYPRGYTPQRLREVAEKVIDPQVKTTFSGREEVLGVDSVHARSFMAGPGKDIYVDKEPTRRLVDTVARSTVPIEHLSNLQFSAYHGIGRYGDTSLEEEGGAVGLYFGPGSRASGYPANARGRGSIKVLPGHTGDSTVIHEIGHHVSQAIEKTPHANYRTPLSRGQEEAYADNYAQQHYRDRRGRPIEVGTYASGHRSADRNEGFYEAYHAKRGTEYVHAYSNPIRRLPDDPQTHVYGQQALVNKIHNDISPEDQMALNLGRKKIENVRTYRPEINYQAHPGYPAELL